MLGLFESYLNRLNHRTYKYVLRLSAHITLGLWQSHSPTPFGFQIKMCKHIFAWKPRACFT